VIEGLDLSQVQPGWYHQMCPPANIQDSVLLLLLLLRLLLLLQGVVIIEGLDLSQVEPVYDQAGTTRCAYQPDTSSIAVLLLCCCCCY
jgi:hypothetical protein